eukprot:scaffold5938_cov122-Isochrysis_galbana.AAC.3
MPIRSMGVVCPAALAGPPRGDIDEACWSFHPDNAAADGSGAPGLEGSVGTAAHPSGRGAPPAPIGAHGAIPAAPAPLREPAPAAGRQEEEREGGGGAEAGAYHEPNARECAMLHHKGASAWQGLSLAPASRLGRVAVGPTRRQAPLLRAELGCLGRGRKIFRCLSRHGAAHP